MKRHADILDAFILTDYDLIKSNLKYRVPVISYITILCGIMLLVLSRILYKEGRW